MKRKSFAAPRTRNPVRYHLRITVIPGIKAAEEKALWKIIRTGKIDEVAFFAPHAEDRSPGLGTREEIAQFVSWFAPRFRKLRKSGVTPSINVFWTMGFSNPQPLPRDQHDQFPFRWAVAIDGRESRVIACPLGSEWRAHVRDMYREFARLQPARLWIDDDVRATLRADMQCPCFCAACLGEMERRTGKAWTREELIKAILADPAKPALPKESTGPHPVPLSGTGLSRNPDQESGCADLRERQTGSPLPRAGEGQGEGSRFPNPRKTNPIRDAWLAFQGEIIRSLFEELAVAVHEVSPQTHLGAMFSPVEIHFAEGRDWEKYFAALGQPQPYSRPHLSPYMESLAVTAADGFNSTRMAQAVLPASVVTAPEVENFPHTHFAKSVKFMRLQMTLCQLLGLNEVTVAMYRYGGRLDLERENAWEQMLGDSKPYFQAIADLGIQRDQFRGVGLYWHPEVCRHTRVPSDASKPIFVYRQRPLDTALSLFGIATRYGAGEVTVITAEHVCCLGDDELEQVFSRGVLLDARAADCLIAMGRGELAGVVRRLDPIHAITETVDQAGFGHHGEPMSIRSVGMPWQFELVPGVRVVSTFRDYKLQPTGQGMFIHENSLGGRVAVLPFDSQDDRTVLLGTPASNALTSPSFLEWTRQAQLLGALELVGRKPVPLFVPKIPGAFPLLIDQGKRLVIGVANFSSDPTTGLELRLANPRIEVKRVRSLGSDGKWRLEKAVVNRQRGGLVTVQSASCIDHLGVAILILE